MLRFLFRRRNATPEEGPVKVIVGLGNPGREYAQTRHNVGWWVVDHLADVWRFEGWKRNGDAQVSSGKVGPYQVRLVKPQTYMNLSGSVLKPYLRRAFWAPQTDLLVVVDEVALPVGSWRFRPEGSAGGHNGLKSVEGVIGHRAYARLRIGIKPAEPERSVGDLSNYVLGRFGKAEADTVRELMDELTEMCVAWVKEGAKGALDAQSRLRA